MMPDTAMALSMMVEITSLIPRVTFSTPATPAYAEPTVMPTKRISMTCSGAGRWTTPPTSAATSAARRYWPSTPMLKRFIRNPIAAAMPEMNNGVARLRMSTCVSSLLACFSMSLYAWSGLLPASSSTIDEAMIAKTKAINGAAAASMNLRNKDFMTHLPAARRRSCMRRDRVA